MAHDTLSGSSDESPNARSTFSNLLADGLSREFIWGCELTKEKPSATWAEAIDVEEQDYLRHTLFLKQAVLGANAIKNEKNVVVVETVNYYKETVKQPIISLASGNTESCMLDLNFAGDIPLTFTLIAGSGPVFITAAHLIECPENAYEDEGTEPSNESESISEDLQVAAETAAKPRPLKEEMKRRVVSSPVQKEQLVPKAKKRKATRQDRPSSAKREKLDDKAFIGGEDVNDSDDVMDDGDDDDDDDDDDCRYQLAEENVDERGSSESSDVDNTVREKKFKGTYDEADSDDDDMQSEDKDEDNEDESEDDDEEESSPEKTTLKKISHKNETLKQGSAKVVIETEKSRKLSASDRSTPVLLSSKSRKQKKT